jgi:carbonic anhydrase
MRPIGLVLPIVLGAVACAEATQPSRSPPPAVAAAPVEPRPHWTYAGDTGPEHWGDLDPSFGLCSHGAKQTPVDLPLHATTAHAPARPQWTPVPLHVVNNGHAIQVDDVAPSSFTVDGTTYMLAQFHFHSPAEHTIAGHAYDAEMHLVHKSSDGKILVVGLLFTNGAENAVLKPVWDAMPSQAGGSPVIVPNVAIDVASLLPSAPRYLRYEGSLTVPPCTEGVTWLVVEPDSNLSLSADQIARLRAATQPATNRPVQLLRERVVTELVP